MKANASKMGNLIGGVVFAGVVLLLAVSVQAQNLFVGVSGTGGGSIIELTSGGNESTFASSVEANAMAFNSAGDLFVFSGNFAVYKYSPQGTQTLVTAFGTMSSFGMAFNNAGDLFLAIGNTGDIIEIATNGTKSTFATGLDGPVGLAFNNAGDLFVANEVNGIITEIVTNGTKSTFASGLNEPFGLAFNGAGDLFVSEIQSNDIVEITTNGLESVYATNMDSPRGLTLDGEGNLFVASSSGNCIFEIASNGVASTFAYGLFNTFPIAFQPVPKLQTAISSETFQLTVLEPLPYYTAIVQASPDLMNWTNVCTNTPPFTFTDSMVAASRFYRAVLDANFY